MLLLPLLALFPLAASCTVPPELYYGLVPQKVLATAKSLPATIRYPQYTDSVGKWLLFDPRTWTSGFFPATLYALEARKQLCGATSGNSLGIADWLNWGRSTSNGLLTLSDANGIGHDVGFLSFAFADELLINPQNSTAVAQINRFATILANRYVPAAKVTRSWGSNGESNVQVIIDNMMNLEVLYLSADLTGNNTLRTIAVNHADTNIANHIRSDGGTWHVVEYYATNGSVISKHTAQGYADSSTWSRGQAWGIYGFANMYRRTGFARYLTTTRRLADYFIQNTPSTGIVPWDFNAPRPGPADTAATTIAATGLLMLAQLDAERSKEWSDAAINLLYHATGLAFNPSWQSILSNGTVNRPANNQLTGTVYGDYYYILAGTELVKMGLATC